MLYSYKKPRETKNRRVNLKDENLEVAIKEDFFDIIYSIHSIQKGHIGMNKTYVAIAERYHHFPRIVSDQFIRFCGICGLSLIQHSQNRLTCIETKL